MTYSHVFPILSTLTYEVFTIVLHILTTFLTHRNHILFHFILRIHVIAFKTQQDSLHNLFNELRKLFPDLLCPLSFCLHQINVLDFAIEEYHA